MKLTSLEELYIAELQDLYSAENQIAQHLPEVIEAVQNDQFKQSLTAHLEETKQQVHRIRQIFEELEESPDGNECEAAQGLLKEAAEIISETEPGVVRDVALAGAAQRVEYYEQAAYETAIRLAECLDYSEHVELLGQSLSEERAAGEKVAEAGEMMGEEESGMEFSVPTEDGRLKVEGKPEATGNYARPPEDAHTMIEADDEENIYQDEDAVTRGSGATG